ncbi:hypothetical protein TNCV_609961 [Trichonephila clavipes]|nr:hypothetical protein TNCV_609961 [Trichonephila clavipes]
MWPSIVIHKNDVRVNDTSEQTHMGKKYLLTIAIPDYRSSVGKCGASSVHPFSIMPLQTRTPGPPYRCLSLMLLEYNRVSIALQIKTRSESLLVLNRLSYVKRTRPH